MKKITCALALVCAVGGGGLVRAGEFASSAAIEDAVQFPSSSYLEQMWDVIFYTVSMVGIKYSRGGNSPQTGFDCSGLVTHVFKKISGLVLPRTSYAIARVGQPVPADELKPGDLVFFDTMRRPFSHVGIYVGDRRFVHAPSTGKQVDIADMTQSYWARRYNGARRISR
jgi:cell wall-associated NlpC family hydrolase